MDDEFLIEKPLMQISGVFLYRFIAEKYFLFEKDVVHLQDENFKNHK